MNRPGTGPGIGTGASLLAASDGNLCCACRDQYGNAIKKYEGQWTGALGGYVGYDFECLLALNSYVIASRTGKILPLLQSWNTSNPNWFDMGCRTQANLAAVGGVGHNHIIFDGISKQYSVAVHPGQ